MFTEQERRAGCSSLLTVCSGMKRRAVFSGHHQQTIADRRWLGGRPHPTPYPEGLALSQRVLILAPKNFLHFEIPYVHLFDCQDGQDSSESRAEYSESIAE